MKQEHDIEDLADVLTDIEPFVKSKELVEYELKRVKREILKLEIAVVVIGLICLSLIALPFFSVLTFNFMSVLAIIFGILLIVKAFWDGGYLETQKFVLLLLLSNKKQDDEIQE